jgi:hypothetical protein
MIIDVFGNLLQSSTDDADIKWCRTPLFSIQITIPSEHITCLYFILLKRVVCTKN